MAKLYEENLLKMNNLSKKRIKYYFFIVIDDFPLESLLMIVGSTGPADHWGFKNE